jgi:hypothetical protein
MRFGGPHEAALKAIEDPDFKRVFEDLGGVRVEEQNGRLYVVPSNPTSENRMWDAVYAWAEGELLAAEPIEGVGTDGTAVVVEPDLRGRPLPALPTLEAIKLYGEGATAYRVDKETALSYRQALRVETWVKGGAVWWDAIERRPRVARGFRILRDGEGDSATFRLERA